jgi:hypothetical protein
MSNASFTSKSPGDYINANTMNAAFDSIEAGSASGKLDKDNFADECIGPKMLARLGVCSHRVTVENTNALTGSTSGGGTYDGGQLHMISHGSATPLEIVFGGGAGVSLNEGDVLRFEWTQYLHAFQTVDPIGDAIDIDWAAFFHPRWDTGTGYTGHDITSGSDPWMTTNRVRAGRTCQTATDTEKFKQQDRRHIRGSGVYIVPAGGKTVVKLGLAVTVWGANTPAYAQVVLGQGSITAMIYRR